MPCELTVWNFWTGMVEPIWKKVCIESKSKDLTLMEGVIYLCKADQWYSACGPRKAYGICSNRTPQSEDRLFSEWNSRYGTVRNLTLAYTDNQHMQTRQWLCSGAHVLSNVIFLQSDSAPTVWSRYQNLQDTNIPSEVPQAPPAKESP